MIKPHHSDHLIPLLVQDPDRREKAKRDAETLPSVLISSASAANAVMLGGGYFTPLPGFMDKSDTMSVARTMRTGNGLFWPVPVLCLTDSAEGICDGQSVALRDPNRQDHPVLAIVDDVRIETLENSDIGEICEHVYRTRSDDHPGVRDFLSQGNVMLSGPVRVLDFSYFETDFPDTFRTAVQIREAITKRGWNTVVAFQTRNPMHRAHEELCRTAMERIGADGCVVHMLLGKLKPGDIPANVRDAAIRTMVDCYFPPNTVMITGYGFDMLYAGPREAVLHAIFRQNMGATHFIIGRDHAGVGDYYGAFDAQDIFDEEVPEGALEIEIFRADHTAWSSKLKKVVMMREAPNHELSDFMLISGTRLREMLSEGIAPPPEFSRPEVARILIDHYRGDG
ncbi:MAG: sulfate adenylyltransferase [Gammaproteobacteria bacterium]|nr:sulfate adenylyltransferase [Gammaproteobacteria bacterium]MYD76826.1 sulfate adenylyltransferase [Gammaproteobacteria bacterium]MYJ51405.1 sulfate adenylyltransferase [Gammaproteobacteria bacterium]